MTVAVVAESGLALTPAQRRQNYGHPPMTQTTKAHQKSTTINKNFLFSFCPVKYSAKAAAEGADGWWWLLGLQKGWRTYWLLLGELILNDK